ncbi:MAG: hypothetical protein ACK5GV_11945 [Bacteroidota bacterium]|jgi:hypothetical protein
MSKFLDFLGDLKAYVPSGGDVLKTLLANYVGVGEQTSQEVVNSATNESTITEFFKEENFNKKYNRDNKEFYSKDSEALIYPEDLFQSGNEAYILFFMRDSVYADAKLMKRIALYMPGAIGVNYGAQWSPINMFIAQDQRSSLKSSVDDILTSTSNDEALNLLKQKFGKDSVGQEAFLTAATKFITQAPMTENALGQAASVIAGKTINPMTSLAFRSVNLRKFRFRFELMARSENESKSINRIINCFKYGMHPEALNSSIPDSPTANKIAGKIFLEYPNTFDIFLFSPSAEYLFQIQRSVITNMDVNYNANKVASFFKKTGAPTNITLEIDFQETELLTKDRVVKGY